MLRVARVPPEGLTVLHVDSDAAREARVCFIVSTCCPVFSTIVDLFTRMGHGAKSNGLDPFFVLSGAETCSHIIRLEGNRDRCGTGFRMTLDALRAAFGPNAVLTPSEDLSLGSAVEELWARVSGSPPRERVLLGVDLYQLCRASVARRLRTPPGSLLPHDRPDEEETTSDFQRDALRHLIFYRRVFERWQPSRVCYLGGHFHQDRAAYVVCRELGIPSLAFEASFVPGMLYCDDYGVTGNRGGMAQDTRHWREVHPSNTADRETVDDLMWRSFQLYGNVPARDTSRETIRHRLGIAPTERVLLFICQAPFDSSVISDGGEFANQLSAVLAVLRAIEHRPDARLIVRFHPTASEFERAWIASPLLDHRPQVLLIANDAYLRLPLYETLLASDVAVTVNSQTALQAAWMGLPVLTLGIAFYAAKGFTIDLHGGSAMFDAGIAAVLRAAGPREPLPALVDFIDWLRREYMVVSDDTETLVQRLARKRGLSPVTRTLPSDQLRR
jgi:hypothetical protein